MAKSDWIIRDSIVQSVRLIQPYHWYKRYDVLPFMIAYAIVIPLSLLEDTKVLTQSHLYSPSLHSLICLHSIATYQFAVLLFHEQIRS